MKALADLMLALTKTESKRCPGCNWPYLEYTDYAYHLAKDHCRLFVAEEK